MALWWENLAKVNSKSEDGGKKRRRKLDEKMGIKREDGG